MDSEAGSQLVVQLASWGLIGAMALAAAIQPFGCTIQDPAGTEDDPDVARLLEDLATLSGPEAVAEAQPAIVALAAAAETWRDASDAPAAKASAQDAWIEASIAWQHVELFQIGPTGSSLTTAGGADLRDELYSWPTVNRCRVEQELVEGAWDDPDYFTNNLVNSYGLDALEVLLFAPDAHDCPTQVDLDTAWDAVGAEERELRRAEFAAVLADHALSVADEVAASWEDGWGLTEPGSDASVYASQSEALNAAFDMLIYLKVATKDQKLGGPLGLCDRADCDTEVESPLSGASHHFIAANLVAFRNAFDGLDGYGFDDLLVDRGHADLTDAVHAALDDADAAVLALDAYGDLETALNEDPAAVETLHGHLTTIADLLKGDIATVLSLQLPDEAAGDND